MNQSRIVIDVTLNENRFRNNKLAGHGNNSGFHTPGKGHAIAFWDSADKAALRMGHVDKRYDGR